MSASRKTKAELLSELETLRARIAHLEESETNLKQANQSLKFTNVLLERFFASTHVLIAYMDTDFNFIRVNRAYAAADGRTPKFYVGKNHFDLFPNEENRMLFQRAVDTGEAYTAYAKPFTYAEHPERGVTYWDWILIPIKNAAGKVEAVALCLIDRTELIRAEQSLRESEERYRLHFEHVGDVIYVLDRDFRITDVSPSIEGLLGYSPKEIVGRRIDELGILSPEYLQKAFENAKRVLAGNNGGPREYVFIAKDGTRKIGEIIGTPLISDGGVVAVVAVARDVTARKQAEQELAKYREHLEEMVQERTVELKQANEQLQQEIAERKQVEEALRESEEKLRQQMAEIESIYDSAHIGLCVFDRELHYVRINELLAEINGVPASDHIGKTPREIVPDLAPVAEELAQKIFRTGMPVLNVEVSGTTQAQPGVQRYWIEHWLPLKDAAGEVFGINVVVEEITERKRAEEALRETTEHLSGVLTSISDGFFTLDNGLVVTYFNKAAEELLGRKAEEVLGRQLFEALPEGKGSIFEKKYTYALKNKKRLAFETYFGVEPYVNWYEVRVYPHKDGISVYFRVTTERKQVEEAVLKTLDESRRHATETAALLESSRAVLEYQDFDQAAKAIFDSCKRLIGADAGYVSLLSHDGTQNDAVFLDPGTSPCAVDPNLPMPIRGLRAEAYRSGRPAYDNNFAASEYTKYLPAGHSHIENVLFAPLIMSGHAIGLIGLANKPGGFTDDDARLAAAFADHAAIAFRNSRYLAAIRKSEARYRNLAEGLEETVRKKVEELQQAESLAAIGRMVSVVAHEVRNPLQNIQMGVDGLRKELRVNKSALDILGDIDHGMGLLNRIVGQLLEYSRPVKLDCAPWPIKDVVDAAVKRLSHRLLNITVHTDVESKERAVHLDAEKMAQALVNLVSNAAEAMPNGGDVWICSKFIEADGEESLNITVSDSGCGIPDENLSMLHQPFFTTKPQGTGLGIHICRKIVDAHRGTLNIRSTANEGTTVEIILPV